ncbi:hypothetical protein [Pollutibacter soli]|uniref:hypothetical protein n=1 Tax=Pollutibacter soli TaxID=3034157 RepID=UPI0030132D4D
MRAGVFRKVQRKNIFLSTDFFALCIVVICVISCSKSPVREADVQVKPCGPDSMYFTITPSAPPNMYYYEYDDKGRTTTISVYGPLYKLYSYHYNFNAEGNVISWIERNTTGDLLRDRKAIYDVQGRMTGYTQEGWGVGGFAERLASFGYASQKFTTANIDDGDTAYHSIHFYEDEDLVRSEHYLSGQLQFIDSIAYSSQLNIPILEKSADQLMNKVLPSKHYPSRKIVYDVFSQNRMIDDSYGYEFDTDGRPTKITLKSNITHITPPEDRTYRYWYSCK